MGNELTYELVQPIEYASKGESVEAAFVTLNPPTSKNMTECAVLKQAFFRALPKATDEVEMDASEDAEDPTGEAIMQMITMSTSVDLGKVLLTGKELLTSGIALVDGEEKLTKPLFDRLSQDDVEGMIGEYMVNFILASALRRLRES